MADVRSSGDTLNTTAQDHGNESTWSKLSREAYVIGGGLWDGAKTKAWEFLQAPQEHMPTIALSVGIGATLAYAQKRAGLLGIGAELAGLAFTASFAKDLLDRDRLSQIATSMSDTWNSSANLDNNRAKIKTAAGEFAFDSALMFASGAAGAGMVRGPQAIGAMDMFKSKSGLLETKAPEFRMDGTPLYGDAAMRRGLAMGAVGTSTANLDHLPQLELFPSEPLTAPKGAQILTSDKLNMPVEQLQNAERIDWTTPNLRGEDIHVEWTPSEASFQVRQQAQAFVQAFMNRDYLGALKTAIESPTIATGVDLNPTTRATTKTFTLNDLNDPGELRFKLESMSKLGEFKWDQVRRDTEWDTEKLQVVVPEPIIQLSDGTTRAALVDFVKGSKGYNVVLPDYSVNGTPLTAVQLAELNSIRNSPHGQRLMADIAATAFEESIVHANQHISARGGIISPSFAEFAKSFSDEHPGARLHKKAFMGVVGRLEDGRVHLYEQEVPAILYDAGMPLDLIERLYFFGSRHVPERTPVIEYLRQREADLKATKPTLH